MAPVPSDLRSLRLNHHKEEAPADELDVSLIGNPPRGGSVASSAITGAKDSATTFDLEAPEREKDVAKQSRVKTKQSVNESRFMIEAEGYVC